MGVVTEEKCRTVTIYSYCVVKFFMMFHVMNKKHIQKQFKSPRSENPVWFILSSIATSTSTSSSLAGPGNSKYQHVSTDLNSKREVSWSFWIMWSSIYIKSFKTDVHMSSYTVLWSTTIKLLWNVEIVRTKNMGKACFFILGFHHKISWFYIPESAISPDKP